MQKKRRNPMVGNMKSLHRGQTRGAGYVGPAEGKGRSEKGLHSRRHEYDIKDTSSKIKLSTILSI